jgi:tritrans,polycis-undecaprenyl-diphosphate synthase [geranylgeranyl-diphosphate specific]
MEAPKHIAIIIDGNRRFAQKMLNHPFKGHEEGARKMEMLIDWAKELGIKELTLYIFSIQNFRRPKEEVDYLFDLFEKKFNELAESSKLGENGIRINFIGRLFMFPKGVQEGAKKLTEKTKNNRDLVVNFAMGYGGREEIVDATKKIAEKVKKGEIEAEDIDEDLFEQFLYSPSQPDIIIRTSGEMRISNFLNFQSAYSELFFVKKLWPEFEKEDLVGVIKQFRERNRRFGG